MSDRKLKPWTDESWDHYRDDDELHDQLWESIKPDELLFTIVDSEDGPMIWICPVQFYEENGHLYDQHIWIKEFDILEQKFGFHDLMEAAYCINNPEEIPALEQEMLALGFVKSEEFDSFMKEIEDEETPELYPNEILFSVLAPGGSYPYIIMTPIYHFEMSHSLYGKTIKILDIDTLQKYGFKETSYSTFEIDDPSQIREVVLELRNLGFKESEKFDNFVLNPGAKKEHVCDDDCSHDEDKEPTKMEVLSSKLDELREELKAKLLEGDSLTKDRLDFEQKEFYTKANAIVEEVMGFSIDHLKSLLGEYVDEHAERLCSTIEYIAENNDFDKGFYDEKPAMVLSMRRGATTFEAWQLKNFGNAPNIPNHLYFTFSCDFINGGEDFDGVVCVDSNGKIKHHFVQKAVQ